MKKYLLLLCTLFISFPLIALNDKDYVQILFMKNKLEIGEYISAFESEFNYLDFDVKLIEEKQNEDFNVYELYNENIRVYYYAKLKKIFLLESSSKSLSLLFTEKTINPLGKTKKEIEDFFVKIPNYFEVNGKQAVEYCFPSRLPFQENYILFIFDDDICINVRIYDSSLFL